MDRSVIAALISALAFPGAGHLFLKRARRGLVFMVPTLVAAFYFISQVVAQATALAEQVLAGALPADPVAIAARLERDGVGSPLTTLSVIVMLACWAGAIIDSFLLGRRAPE